MKVRCTFLVHLYTLEVCYGNAYLGLEALQSVWLLMLLRSCTPLENLAALEEPVVFFPTLHPLKYSGNPYSCAFICSAYTQSCK